MSIPTKPSPLKARIEIIILLLLVALSIIGVVSLVLNNGIVLTYVVFFFTVFGVFFCYLSLKP